MIYVLHNSDVNLEKLNSYFLLITPQHTVKETQPEVPQPSQPSQPKHGKLTFYPSIMLESGKEMCLLRLIY